MVMRFSKFIFTQVRCIHSGLTSLTSQEVAAALRPFIFSIHPDRFWRYPKEKNINEANLKKLNEFLESNRNCSPCGNETVTFYMQNTENTSDKVLKVVQIKLNSAENVNANVHKILSQCSLPTDYLLKIGKLPGKSNSQFVNKSGSFQNRSNDDSMIFGNFSKRHGNDFFYGDAWDDEFSGNFERKQPKTTKLVEWLLTNCDSAREKSRASRPIQIDLERLRHELISELSLKDLRWQCDWSVSHIRGCLKNLSTLASQYPSDMMKINNKTLIFGRQSGIGCDGEVILNIEDVRTSWLDLIRSVKHKNSYVVGLKSAEMMLSDLLNGIRIVRPESKVQLAKHYFDQINRFSRTLREYLDNNNPPDSWPDCLSNYRLTVDSDSGPLMLTNDGAFNIPASCPGKLALRHIMENIDAAKLLIDNERNNRQKYHSITRECIEKFHLQSLQSDENITAEQMIDFGKRLLEQSSTIGSCLTDANLRVSMYYSVLNDGQLCVPFNFN